MTTLLMTLLFACGDKEETDTSPEEVVEETTEDTGSTEEGEDTATSEEQ
jgi:hypothetical protein